MKLFFYIILSALFLNAKALNVSAGYYQVPVLCYHNVTKTEGKKSPFWISGSQLNEQLKVLHDSGYHTILPEQLYQHLVKNSPLPPKPILLSFDDTHEEHFSIVANVLKKYDYKAVFFIMTVCIGKKGYLDARQIRALSEIGNVIGCHTYDHPITTTLEGPQWEKQINKPKQTLERITGRPVEYFAYPNGIWSESVISELKKCGIKAAFQLLGKQSQQAPEFTIRRMMVPGNWSGKELIQRTTTLFTYRQNPAAITRNVDGPRPENKFYSFAAQRRWKIQPTTVDLPVLGVANRVLTDSLFKAIQLHLVHNKPSSKWPVKTPPPLPGSILPFKRIIAFYGNFYSKGMGILGQLPPDQMLSKLQQEVEKWQAADSLIMVQPALHYIAITAQRKPGKDNKYRLHMPGSQIEKALMLAKKINALVFLDVQVGHSTLKEELPLLLPYLKMENVHLGIDPEYSMKNGEVPCSVIGTFDAADINDASAYLARLVKEYKLPPKVLIVHRFTNKMVTNYRNIIIHPEVQVVMSMDGFGFPAKKIDSYRIIAAEPTQFTGFKLFYKQDTLSAPHKLMTPAEIIKLNPSPVYIQYQ